MGNERKHPVGLVGDGYRDMHREATRPGGLKRLLRWLARQVEGNVVLLDHKGAPLHADPELPTEVLAKAAPEIERVVSGEFHSAAADLDAGLVNIQSVGQPDPSATLIVTRREPLSPPLRCLIGDVSRLVGLLWRVENLDRRQQRLNRAEMHTREAVLHLLVVGQIQAARRIAGALGPGLADEIRVFIMEGPADVRDQSIAYCDQVTRGRAWIVRCPIYTRHVIILAPAQNEAEELEKALQSHVRRVNGVDVGSSNVVAIRDMGSGYGQAFHALALARASTGHYARFSPRGDLAALLRPRGYEWAKTTLAPLTEYRRSRPQDLDSAEIIATLRSWLDFYGGAARQMKIHRNTLASRLQHIQQLLGRSLDNIATQSMLYLALLILDGPGGGGGLTTLDELLDDPEVRRWADLQTEPLLKRDPLLMDTLRVWLDNNARVAATAATLGLSVKGTRLRLTRIEEILERSLLTGPSARYDMWFALKVRDASRGD